MGISDGVSFMADIDVVQRVGKNHGTVTGVDGRYGNYFDFGRVLRDAIENGEAEESMHEISKLIREFHAKISLLEYKLLQMESRFNQYEQKVMAILLVVVALAVLVLWKLYFGGE